MINITTPLIYSCLDIPPGLAIYENDNITSDLCCKSVSKDKKVNLSGNANVLNRSEEADLSQDIFP